jgi:hypothetical protein
MEFNMSTPKANMSLAAHGFERPASTSGAMNPTVPPTLAVDMVMPTSLAVSHKAAR